MQHDESGRVICGRKKKDGNPCGAPPIKGGTVCVRHGGRAGQVAKAAAKREAEREARETMEKAVTTLGLPRDIDPGKALLDEIARTYGAVLWLEGKVRELEPDDLVWGKAIHEHGLSAEGPVDKTTDRADFSMWYRMYTEERDRLARVAALALKSGIEERRIRLAESQGDLVAGAIRQILDALQLTPDQWQQVPVIVPQALRALGEEAS